MPQYDVWRQPYSKEQLAAAANNLAPTIDATTGNWRVWDIAAMTWADTGIPAAGKNPYIGDDNYWYVWDAAANQYANTGYCVAQDAVQSVNGVFANDKGNVVLPWTSFTGANPVAKGGTGKTTAPSGLRALIDACSALTGSGVASGDFVPLQDASDSTNAKKITLDNLTAYLAANIPYLPKIQTGNYIGTGTHGEDNPTSITFGFAPKLVFCGESQSDICNYYLSSSSRHFGTILTALLTTEYQTGCGFGQGSSSELYAKISLDGKTVSWYRSGNVSAMYQNNASGTTYYWLAIG